MEIYRNPRMTIRYDYQIFCKQPYGGISRYFYELIKQFSDNQAISVQLNLFASDNLYLQQLKGSNWWNHIYFKGKKDINRMLCSGFDFLKFHHQNFDVFHPTYYNQESLNRTGKKPMAITIHDLIDEKFHQNHPRFSSLLQARKKHIERADKIIAVSNNTKSDLMEIYGVSESKITTIYHGNTFTSITPSKILPSKIAGQYLLFIGTRFAHKNFQGMVNAITPILRANPLLKLVCGGGPDFSPTELKFFQQNDIGSQIMHTAIKNDFELAGLYNAACVFIYPSLYEGFGLPILEAFSNGCAVATGIGSCTKEIAGNAASFFDPNSEASIHDIVLELLNNITLQQIQIEKGYQRCKEFSWEKTANQTLQLYQMM